MAEEIHKIPNKIRSWKEAASYIYKEKCGGTSAEQINDYRQKLEQANSGRSHPAAADIRWWPWIHHVILNRPIIFEGPNPVCPKPEPETVVKPKEPGPVSPPEPKADLPALDISAPPKVKQPAKVTRETQKSIEKAIRSAAVLTGKLNNVGLKETAAKLNEAKKEATKAASGNSEARAKQALDSLNIILKDGEKAYNKIREELK